MIACLYGFGIALYTDPDPIRFDARQLTNLIVLVRTPKHTAVIPQINPGSPRTAPLALGGPHRGQLRVQPQLSASVGIIGGRAK
jgi:hypothetical protein